LKETSHLSPQSQEVKITQEVPKSPNSSTEDDDNDELEKEEEYDSSPLKELHSSHRRKQITTRSIKDDNTTSNHNNKDKSTKSRVLDDEEDDEWMLLSPSIPVRFPHTVRKTKSSRGGKHGLLSNDGQSMKGDAYYSIGSQLTQKAKYTSNLQEEEIDSTTLSPKHPNTSNKDNLPRKKENLVTNIPASVLNLTATSKIEDEIFWEVRLSQNMLLRETKLFFFGNVWWSLLFGASPSDPNYFYFFICPAEKLKIPAIVWVEFRLHPTNVPLYINSPPPPPLQTKLLVSSSVPSSGEEYRYEIEGKRKVAYDLPDLIDNKDKKSPAQQTTSANTKHNDGTFIRSSECNYLFPTERSSLVHGFEQFIYVEDIKPFISNSGKIKLSIHIVSNIGPEGQLVGRNSFST
jgi:hypothetical protein